MLFANSTQYEFSNGQCPLCDGRAQKSFIRNFQQNYSCQRKHIEQKQTLAHAIFAAYIQYAILRSIYIMCLLSYDIL